MRAHAEQGAARECGSHCPSEALREPTNILDRQVRHGLVDHVLKRVLSAIGRQRQKCFARLTVVRAPQTGQLPMMRSNQWIPRGVTSARRPGIHVVGRITRKKLLLLAVHYQLIALPPNISCYLFRSAAHSRQQEGRRSRKFRTTGIGAGASHAPSMPIGIARGKRADTRNIEYPVTKCVRVLHVGPGATRHKATRNR